MNISIGQLADLFGMTKEAIRYYERKGLIKPLRDAKNSYRIYNNEHIQILGTIKKLQNVGLSLSEISDILYSTTEEDFIEIHKRYIEKKKHEIAKITKLLEKMEMQNDILINLNEDKNHYSIIDCESKLFFNFETIEKLIKDIDQDSGIEKWFGNLMFTNASGLIVYNTKTEEILRSDRGLIVNASEAKMLGIEKSKYIIEVEESRYLRSVLKYEHSLNFDKNLLHEDMLKQIIQKMKTALNDKFESVCTILTKNICVYANKDKESKVIITEVLLKLDN